MGFNTAFANRTCRDLWPLSCMQWPGVHVRDLNEQNGDTRYASVRGADGLDWPPDPLRDDLSRSFDRAWRLDPKRHTASAPLVIRDLPPGARLGVRNHGPGYHAPAPVRAYTVEVAAGDGQQTGHLNMYA